MRRAAWEPGRAGVDDDLVVDPCQPRVRLERAHRSGCCVPVRSRGSWPLRPRTPHRSKPLLVQLAQVLQLRGRLILRRRRSTAAGGGVPAARTAARPADRTSRPAGAAHAPTPPSQCPPQPPSAPPSEQVPSWFLSQLASNASTTSAGIRIESINTASASRNASTDLPDPQILIRDQQSRAVRGQIITDLLRVLIPQRPRLRHIDRQKRRPLLIDIRPPRRLHLTPIRVLHHHNNPIKHPRSCRTPSNQ